MFKNYVYIIPAHDITKIQGGRERLELNGAHQLLVRADRVNLQGGEVKMFGNDANKSQLHSQGIKSKLTSGNACCHAVQNLLSSRRLSKNAEIKIHRTTILPVVLYGSETLRGNTATVSTFLSGPG
jgi:hypothetical protein